MLMDTVMHPERMEMLPYLSLGFFVGCREAELSKILWSDVFTDEARLLIRATVSKTRRKRYIEIPANCLAWLHCYLKTTSVQPEERIMRSYTPRSLRDARAANWKAAGGLGSEPPNSKRRTCASNHIALHEDYDKLSLQLGHTSSAMSLIYVGGVTRKEAIAYFEIRP
jgi:integrase